MLIVSRKHSESILIRPGDDIDPNITLADLFRNGPIEIRVFSVGKKRVKMGVQTPEQLSIRRADAATTS